jgi:methionine sulfoxide reductase heme-binding subunit
LTDPPASNPTGAATLKLIWPWQDRQRRFSALKASTFALLFAPAILLAYQLASGDFGIYPMWLGGLTYWSGVWATAVLLAALAVTPALKIFGWKSLIAVRRMFGVAALAYTIAHILVYFALRFWSFAVIAKEMATSLSLVAATLSTIGLIALGVTSFDAAIRRMGARGWQRLHGTVYVISLLALMHVLLSRGTNPMQYLLVGMFLWLMVWRVLDRFEQGSDPRALAILAVGSCLFTASLEIGWIWGRRGYAWSETLGNNFTLVFGVPPAWQILGLGLLIALAAAWQSQRLPAARFDMRKTG